jgi:hypothetical protein
VAGHKVWLDPAKAMLAVKMESGPYTWQVLEDREVIPGLWLPTHYQRIKTLGDNVAPELRGKVSVREDYTVSQLEVNAVIPAEEFKFEFPAGTNLENQITGQIETVGQAAVKRQDQASTHGNVFQLRWVATANDMQQAEQLPWFDAMELAPRIWVLKDVLLTDDDIASAGLGVMQDRIGYDVWLKFKPDAAERFTRLTGDNIRRRLAMIFDGKVLAAPIIDEKIPSGQVSINGRNMTRQDAEQIVKALGGKVSDRAKSHKVTGKLEFAPAVSADVRKQYSVARLIKMKPQSPTAGQTDLDGTAHWSDCRMTTGGQLAFQDNFKGEYSMALLGEGKGGSDPPLLHLPQTFMLDNLAGDQALGQVLVPGLGKVKFQITWAEPDGPKPTEVIFRLSPIGKRLWGPAAVLTGEQWERELGPVFAGEYEVRIWVAAFKVTPWTQRVKVEPGQTALVQVELKPVGTVAGGIWEKNERAEKKKAVNPRQVILRGPGGERVLKPSGKLTDDEAHAAIEGGRDILLNNGFGFMDLPQGIYELTIEADDYKTYHATRTVIPGKPDAEKYIFMEPASSK